MMKTVAQILTTLSLATSSQAAEFLTITSQSGTVPLPQGHLVEIVGVCANTEVVNPSTGGANLPAVPRLTITFVGGTVVRNALVSYSIGTGDALRASTANDALKGSIFTAVSSMLVDSGCAVTVKLTPPSEINAIGPSTVLVLPENSTGNHDVVLDSSTDLVNWTPFFSQTVTAPAAANFYRARIVKTPTP